ncbi:MAG TPA: hypothetical protein VMU55_05610, partial [Solirubrobacteraceae bacterium]|nr:hypothetical protein [Solirubrobacteraceae bacterium]
NTSSDPATLAPLIENGAQARGITISEDGSTIVFQSDDALTPQVHGGIHNVYEWHDGNVYLLSDGRDTNQHSGLIGMDATGQNVFFTTADKLVGQDSDTSVDVYDARIEGGFPAPLLPAGCKGEECQGPLTAPLGPVSIGSDGPPLVGNLTPSPEKATSVKPKPKKPLTRKQELKRALKRCRKDRSKLKRAKCERAAKAKYGPKPKRKRARKGMKRK